MSEINRLFKAHYILEHYGAENQMLKTIEEMSELNREIVNVLTGKQNRIEEEIADVQVMLLQMQILFDSDNIEKIMDAKLLRQMARIDVEEAEEEKQREKVEDPDTMIDEMTPEEIEDFTKAFEMGLEKGIPEGGLADE